MRVAPPGEVGQVTAETVLVLAPHYDDEVLGCGGLIGLLAEQGARTRVVFLSDGSGGEEVAGGSDYARIRRRESERAMAKLEITEAQHLELRDGALASSVDRLREAVRRNLEEWKPELVLVPSPLETTADHQAAFLALARVLAPLRGETGLAATLAATRFLLYEVNHPGYPDLLVDVSTQRRRLEEAMACYPSQQERHDYLAAALGLRRYRAQTLPRGTELVEAYRALSLSDFQTRSEAVLLRYLGAEPEVEQLDKGPLVSVIVRTRDRHELFAEALRSIADSSYRRVEVVVVNDGGEEPPLPGSYPFPIDTVHHQESRGRAAAANAGLKAARGDLIGFLDDDDLYYPEHLATLVGALSAAGVRVAYTDAAVCLYEAGAGGWRCAERRLPYSRDFDLDRLLLDNYIPFNTVLFDRSLLDDVDRLDESLPFFEDWDFLIRLAKLETFQHIEATTCEYRHFPSGSQQIFGSAPATRPDFLKVKASLLSRHLPPQGETLARAVSGLRDETVRAREHEAAAVRSRSRTAAELAQLQRVHHELALRFHASESDAQRLRELYAEASAAHQERAAEFHRVNGELSALGRTHEDLARRFHEMEAAHVALRGEQDALVRHQAKLSQELDEIAAQKAMADDGLRNQDAELRRLYDEEALLRADLESQTELVSRTYAEIARLSAELEETRASRWWRLGQRLTGWRRR